MCDSVRVLSWANGDPAAPLMFIGEAPGRLGADRTAIPFHGDKAGDNFERLLALSGLSRSDVFITNAVLCNPRDEKGNNRPPHQKEMENCARHLKAQIELSQPAMVMTLGSVALEATRLIDFHDLTLRSSVRTAYRWFERLLLPLYHPGARAMIHRSFANQTADYYFVGETFRRIGQRRRKPSAAVRGAAYDWELVKYVLQRAGRVSNFRLHKLIYLIDVKCTEVLGRRATQFFFLRQKDGPYCVELGSRWYHQFGDQLKIGKGSGRLSYEWAQNGLFSQKDETVIEDEVAKIASEILESTAALDDAKLKARAYLTKPMKEVMRAEKSGRRLLNRPLLTSSV